MSQPPAPIFAGAPLWFDVRAIADPTGRRTTRLETAMLLYGEPSDDPVEPSQLALGLVTRLGLRAQNARDTANDPHLREAIRMLCTYVRRLEDIARQHGELLAAQRAAERSETGSTSTSTTSTTPTTTDQPLTRETDSHGHRKDQGPAHNHD